MGSFSRKEKHVLGGLGQINQAKSLRGFRTERYSIINQALLEKVAWRILTSPSCLLARVLTGKYCHKKSFLDAQLPAVCSHSWRSILHGRDLLKENLGKAIGNDQNTKVWKDTWISLDNSSKPMGPIHESALDLRVSDLLTDDLQWNKARIEQYLPDFSADPMYKAKQGRGRGHLCLTPSSNMNLLNQVWL